MVPLRELLTPVSRPEAVDPQKTYHILGAHWYAKGLYTKDIKSGSQIQAKNLYRAEQGDFVYNRLFAWKGSFAVASEENHGCYVSNEFPCFLVNQNRIDSRYLWRYFSRAGIWEEAFGLSTGGTPTSRNRLKEDKLLAMKMPLPPVEEQRRIVAKINELASKIEEARCLRRKAMAEAETLLPSEISYLFSKGKENGWTTEFLRDYMIDDCYGTSEKTSDDNSGTPIFRMGNIQSGRLDLRDLRYLHLNDKDRAKLLLKKGDILVNRTNSAELVGKCAVFDLEGEYGFASYLIRLCLDKDRAEPRLVASYINSPTGRAYMFSERKQMTGQANVNATKLKALPIALPSLPEQRRIVAYLDGLQAKVEVLKHLQSQSSTELDALLPSILDKAFKGEL
jgi:type I restriction enzyme S subunit